MQLRSLTASTCYMYRAGKPFSWTVIAPPSNKYCTSISASCILSYLETTRRARRRLPVPAFRPSPAMNPSLLPAHSTSLDWITTAPYMRATILMCQRCPCETKLLTLELCSEVKTAVNFCMYVHPYPNLNVLASKGSSFAETRDGQAAIQVHWWLIIDYLNCCRIVRNLPWL